MPFHLIWRQNFLHPTKIHFDYFLVKSLNAPGRYTLEIPAGGLNAGEDKLTAAVRELEEETGYKILASNKNTLRLLFG